MAHDVMGKTTMTPVSESPRIVARRLVEADLPGIVELNRTHRDVMRSAKPAAYDEAFELSLRRTYLSALPDGHSMFGAFVDGRLDAYLSVYLWRDFPFFSIGNLKTRPGCVNLLSRQPGAFVACAAVALQYTEGKAAYRGYMLHAIQRWPAERVRRSLVRSFPDVDRYHYEVELVVPKFSRPPYPFAWNLMGQRTWAQDLAIETLTLKQEHRPAMPRSLDYAA